MARITLFRTPAILRAESFTRRHSAHQSGRSTRAIAEPSGAALRRPSPQLTYRSRASRADSSFQLLVMSRAEPRAEPDDDDDDNTYITHSCARPPRCLPHLPLLLLLTSTSRLMVYVCRVRVCEGVGWAGEGRRGEGRADQLAAQLAPASTHSFRRLRHFSLVVMRSHHCCAVAVAAATQRNSRSGSCCGSVESTQVERPKATFEPPFEPPFSFLLFEYFRWSRHKSASHHIVSHRIASSVSFLCP